MTRELLGTIRPTADSLKGKEEWMSLIGTHSSLEPVEPKPGINPFTKNSMVFKPSPDVADVLVDAVKAGVIHWALDGSRQLVVWSEPEVGAQVTAVANDVAVKLGWQFVTCENSRE